MLRVKRLEPGARPPVVAHPGEDLGYDLFALETTVLVPRGTVKVRTGTAVEGTRIPRRMRLWDCRWCGIVPRWLREGLRPHGWGGSDAGYRGEILVLMTNRERARRTESGKRARSPEDDSRSSINRNRRGGREPGGPGTRGKRVWQFWKMTWF